MSGAGRTRAVVVDDSRFMRTLIRTILEDGGIEVVAEAENGREALSTVSERRPDVVTMDIEMPEMNGIEAVEAIMNDCPTPILMLSAHAEKDADVTFDALEKGAVDFVTKPGGEVTSSMPKVKRELVDKVTEAAAVDLSAAQRRRTRGTRTRPAGAGAAGTTQATRGASAQRGAFPDSSTLVIGASTGGPNVVESVVGALPTEANLRVLVVQHMPEGFTGRFAGRLDTRCAYDVAEARDGERVRGGSVRVAPGGTHLVVDDDRSGQLRVRLRDGDRLHGVKPAIDYTMTSAAETIDGPLVGVLLTGMGRDGVDGMGDIARHGGTTIAQDERTAAIFGMPKRAIEAGHVDDVLPAEEIAEGITTALARE